MGIFFDRNRRNYFSLLTIAIRFFIRSSTYLLSFFFISCPYYILYSQSTSLTAIYKFDEEVSKKQQPAQNIFADTIQLKNYLQTYIYDQRNKGYIEASADRIDRKDSIWHIDIHLGKIYKTIKLRNGNIPEPFLQGSRYSPRAFRDKVFSFERIENLLQNILQQAEQKGYPFAEVYLDSIQLDEYAIEAQIFIKLNPFIRWGDIKIDGDLSLSSSYLERYLGIRPDDAYDASRFQKVDKRLQNIPFIQVSKPAGLAFRKGEVDLALFLNKKRSSRFDFIIGFLPNSQLQGRFQLTGAFDAELQNAFGQGERIMAKFEQLRPETQLLQLEFNYPYLLNLPFGADFKFNLYRRDTSYLDLEVNLGVQYLLEGNNYVKVYLSSRSSNILELNENLLRSTQQLPAQLDVSYPAFGVELAWQDLDYRFNPRKGWEILLNGSAGSKRIRRNAQIEELDLGFLYDSLELRSNQFRLQLNSALFLPIFPNTTFKTAIQSAFIFSSQPIYQNEQYRLGGNRLLRGFDEEFFFATNYAVLTNEFRLLIDTNSFLYLFTDYGWLENRTTTRESNSRVFGFGAGISFETRAGIFGISLAFGQQQNIPLDLSSPKVHFGYISRF